MKEEELQLLSGVGRKGKQGLRFRKEESDGLKRKSECTRTRAQHKTSKRKKKKRNTFLSSQQVRGRERARPDRSIGREDKKEASKPSLWVA